MKRLFCMILSVSLIFSCMIIASPLASAASNDYSTWRQSDPEWNKAEAWPASQYPNATMRYMRQAGCLVTSVAMLLRHYNVVNDSNVKTFNPWVCNEKLKSAGSFNSAADLIWEKVGNAFSGFRYAGVATYSTSKLHELYKQGYACIVGVNNNGHFVAVKSASASGSVIMDPGNGYTSLSSFSSVNSIYYFSVKPSAEYPHTCNKGEYVYYWKAHPHPNCYRCSICGEIWVDTSSSRYVADCEECNTIAVTTKATVDITETTAGLPGSYYNPGSKTISEYGAKFGTSKNDLSKTAALSRNESYKNGGIPAYVVRNLTPGTTYYYRSYVVSGGKTYYGEILSLTTKEKASMWAKGIAYPYRFSEGDFCALTGNIQSNNGVKWVFVGIGHEKAVNADNAVQWVSDDVWRTGPTNNYPVRELASALKSYLLEPGEYWISVQCMDDDNNYYHVFDYPFTVLSVEKDTYPVSYDANGGKGAPSSQTKVKGEPLTLSSTIPTSTRTVTFDLNGGNINGSTADYLVTFSATFSCWTTPVASDGSFSKYYPGESYAKDAPLALTAYWSDILEEHLPPVAPTREGYFFSGWYTNPTCTARTSHIGEDMTFYAHWTKSDTTDVHFLKNTQYTQGQFTDVPPNQWFTENVAEAVEFGLMKGDSSSTFQPYGDVTLAQAITMAARIHSIYTTGSESFVQAPGLSWYQVYLDYAYHHDIVDYNYYTGDVQQKATRAQFAEIFANALPERALPAKNNVSDGAIPDVPMQAPYASAVYRLYRAGILAGSDANGTFSPLSYITRAEAAAVVSRMADSDNRIAFSL